MRLGECNVTTRFQRFCTWIREQFTGDKTPPCDYGAIPHPPETYAKMERQVGAESPSVRMDRLTRALADGSMSVAQVRDELGLSALDM